jgi:ADP-heptose:LPS heptosyltransferase
MMVTNDSGPAHFASLLRLPTVVLFGPETPRLYSPLGDTHKDIYAEFACSPCVSVYNGKQSPCTENRCLKSIAVAEVLSEVLACFETASTVG